MKEKRKKETKGWAPIAQRMPGNSRQTRCSCWAKRSSHQMNNMGRENDVYNKGKNQSFSMSPDTKPSKKSL